jgi:type IV pilus assembly protein PilQ
MTAILLGGTAALAVIQPALAAPVQVTAVRLDPTPAGVDIVLQTPSGARPQVFAVNRGDSWTADITNAQLRVPGGALRQANPAPGISQITVVSLDANSIRVTVTGQGGVPTGQVIRPAQGGVVLSVSRTSVNRAALIRPAAPAQPIAVPAPQAATPAPTNRVPAPRVATPVTVPTQPAAAPVTVQPAPIAQTPLPQTPVAQVPLPSVPSLNAQTPAVPNPAVTTQQPPAGVPPLIPGAVPPPVGSIAVSQIDSSPVTIDLGTGERIPRLVLRDAPVREVLSLLARAAGLNLAYSEQPAGLQGPVQPGQQQGPTITLDIENESVQDVFNYVLRVTCLPPSGALQVSATGVTKCSTLEANRLGRTIFVGPRLPDDARDIITRTLRLNQVPVAQASAFLSGQGAITQREVTRIRIEQVGTGINSRFVEFREPAIAAIEAQEGSGPLILRGLSIVTNDRLNTITLVGPPRKVEIASGLLAQLDARRRQVVVNVKVVDVNLLATESFGTSFSFGIGDNFFSVDNGIFNYNYGDFRPPTSTEVQNSLVTPPITNSLFPGGTDVEPFLDSPRSNAPFGTSRNSFLGGGRPPFGTDENPFAAGVTDISTDRVTFALPTLFRFPIGFLARLQAQVVSGNAKILTDPTLTIQEGETAQVNLTQEVVSRVVTSFIDTSGGSRQVTEPTLAPAGLQLSIVVDRIDDNGFISLRVNPTVSAPLSAINTGNGSFVTPLSIRQVQSGLIRLRDGQTLILAGIIQDTDRATVTKVPILGDIPILGALFRQTTRQNQRQEVIVLLTPRVLNDTQTATFGYGYTPGPGVRQVLDQNQRR